MKYEGKVLRGYTKEELADLCVKEGMNIEGMSRAIMLKSLLALEDLEETPTEEKEVSVEEKEVPVVDRGAQIAYERELARRMGGRHADTYEQELARRRGAGTQISGADAVAAEIARRRKVFGGK